MICLLFIELLLLIILILILYIKELKFMYNKTLKNNILLIECADLYEKYICNQDNIIDSQDKYIESLRKNKIGKDY